MRCGRRGIPALAVALLAAPSVADAADGNLEDRLEVLTEEVRRLREQMALPDTDEELEGRHGLAPAASRVYGNRGLSIGGYGEFFFEAPTGETDAVRRADFLRFIGYFGYKFTDRIIMNTEIEWEHATTGSNFEGRSGSVSVEFSYLEFLLREEVNIRAGNLLVPAGFLNRMHEPPFFRGNIRPFVEQRILPTTWRELGAGIHGEPTPGVHYEAYLLNGFDAMRFDSNGVRDGRQKGGRVIWEDVAGILAVDISAAAPWSFGGSVYYGQADQNRQFDGRDASIGVRIAEGHVQVRSGGFEGRALFAASSIGDADLLSAELSDSAGTVVIPERQRGWYVEGAYDVAPWLGIPPAAELLVWARWEDWNLHHEVPTGLAASDAKDGDAVTVGLELKPHPSVVLKADWTVQDNEAGTATDDPFRLGAGFVF